MNTQSVRPVSIKPLIVLFVLTSVIIVIVENKPSNFTGLHFQHFNYLKAIGAGYSDFYGFILKVKPRLAIALAPHKSKILEWLSIASAVLAVVVYETLRKDDTWPHKAVALGITFGLGGLIETPIFWEYLKGTQKTMESAALIIGELFIPMTMYGLSALLFGGLIWVLQELRGRQWVRDENGRLFPKIWSGKRGSLYKIETKEQRILEELTILVARRRRMLGEVLLIVAGMISYFRYPGPFLSLFIALTIITIIFVLLGDVFREVSYRFGAQFMKGAMVKDQETEIPNRDNVKNQKAHGYTKTSPENETDDILGRRRR